MATDPPPRSKVMLVVVDQTRQPEAQWTYRLSDDKPDTPEYGAIRDLRIPTDRVCSRYTELFAWLKTFGCHLPPPDYFTPTPDELAEAAEWIVRPVAGIR